MRVPFQTRAVGCSNRFRATSETARVGPAWKGPLTQKEYTSKKKDCYDCQTDCYECTCEGGTICCPAGVGCTCVMGNPRCVFQN
jgi:hypothetical protein